MTQEEKFKIWNATKPSVAEVGIYLNRLRGKMPDCRTPLYLVYYKDGRRFVRNRFLPEHKNHLYGIVLTEDCMLSLKRITKRNIDDIMAFVQKVINKNDWHSVFSSEEAKISYWVAHRWSKVFAAMAAMKEDINSLQENRDAVQKTLEVLKAQGVKVPKIDWDYLVWLDEGDNYCRTSFRKYDIRQYLKTKGDILVFMNTEPGY